MLHIEVAHVISIISCILLSLSPNVNKRTPSRAGGRISTQFNANNTKNRLAAELLPPLSLTHTLSLSLAVSQCFAIKWNVN